MKSPYKDSFLGVKSLVRAEDKVAVSQNPGDDLYFFTSHPSAGYLDIPGPTICVVMAALREEQRNVLVILEDDIDITLRRGRRRVLARPFYTDRTKVAKCLYKSGLGNIPRYSTKEYLAREYWILMPPWWQGARPRTINIRRGGFMLLGGFMNC